MDLSEVGQQLPGPHDERLAQQLRPEGVELRQLLLLASDLHREEQQGPAVRRLQGDQDVLRRQQSGAVRALRTLLQTKDEEHFGAETGGLMNHCL